MFVDTLFALTTVGQELPQVQLLKKTGFVVRWEALLYYEIPGQNMKTVIIILINNNSNSNNNNNNNNNNTNNNNSYNGIQVKANDKRGRR